MAKKNVQWFSNLEVKIFWVLYQRKAWLYFHTGRLNNLYLWPKFLRRKFGPIQKKHFPSRANQMNNKKGRDNASSLWEIQTIFSYAVAEAPLAMEYTTKPKPILFTASAMLYAKSILPANPDNKLPGNIM